MEVVRWGVAEGRDVGALVGRSQRVAAIFDEPEVMSLHNLHDGVEVEWIAKGVRDHHGRGFLAERVLKPGHVDVVGGDCDVDEHRNEAVLDDWDECRWKDGGNRYHTVNSF